MKASITSLLLLATIAYATSESFQCSHYCKDEGSVFGYEPGSTYSFLYKARIQSLLNSSQEALEDKGLDMQFNVDISAISTCEFQMQVTDGERLGFPGLMEQLTAAPLRFSFHNGKIGSVCSEEVDSPEVTNIKKAVLSAFQNSAQGFHDDILVYETDITGTCETTYKSLRSQDGVLVKKTKNLNACSHRNTQYLSWQTVSYNIDSQAKSLPLLKSNLDCEQVYDDRQILQSTLCEAKHVFQPFSHGDNGAVTVARQELLRVNIAPTSRNTETAPSTIRRSSLTFELGPKEKAKLNLQRMLALFEELHRKTADGVDADVPLVFSRLVFAFQNMDQATMLEVFGKIEAGHRKFYIDAISLVTSTAGIEVMKELYAKEKVTIAQMDSWIVSLSFIKNPSLETIAAIKPLLKMNTTKQNTILALSSLIHRYCKMDARCLEKDPVKHSVRAIETPLAKGCVSSGPLDNEAILLSLKAIGNAGVTTSLGLLQMCYANQNLPIEFRLAAIAAHRRMSCVRNFNMDDFKNYFANARENTEIRIASYLAIMQCASYAVFAQVKDVLLKEEVNQVGSFVWTHITNLQETSVQWKQNTRKLLENDFLRNKFNTDVRKYSRNYEASTFFENLGAGGGIESNVIFTAESYLPRSAMLNFTLDLFGETINVFEVGGRFEGFEQIVENFFGPEGYFSDKSIQSFLENARNSHSAVKDRIKELGDTFRSQKNLEKEPAGTMYAKVFGNELSYIRFRSLEELIGNPISADQAVDLLLGLFRENDVEFTKSFMFLDSSYKVPTITGLPLELTSNGTTTLGLTVKGKVDLKDLWSYKFAVEGKIYPSATMRVTGLMSVAGFGRRTGVQYVGTMNTNTYLDGHVFVNKGKVVDVKINVPKKQMDIIDIKSDIYRLHNDDIAVIPDVTDNVESSEICTKEMFSKITGLQVCHKLKYVNASDVEAAPYFPLTGSFRYGMSIKKTDTFDSYQINVMTQVEEQRQKPQYSMMMYLDTPGSKVDRKLKTSYKLNLETLSLNAMLQSPFTSFEINSHIGKESNKYSFNLETIYNNKEVVSVKSFFAINHSGYDSLANLKYRQRQVAAVSGSLKFQNRGKYVIDLKLEGVTKEPVSIVGDLLFDSNSVHVRSTLASKSFRGNLQSQLNVQPEGVSFSSNLSYTKNSGEQHNMMFLCNVNKLRRGVQFEDSLLLRLENSEQPMYNLFLEASHARSEWYYRNYGRLTFFETTWKTEQKFKYAKDRHKTDFDVQAYLSCPEKNIDYKVLTLYNTSKSHCNVHGLLQLNSVQRLEGSLQHLIDDAEQTMSALVYYPRQTWKMSGLLRQESSENYYLSFNGSHSDSKAERQLITAEGYYTNSSTPFSQDHKVKCTVNFIDNNWSTPWAVTASLQRSNELFFVFTQLKTTDSVYVSHMNWAKDNFAFMLQTNEKPLFAANAAQEKDVLSVFLVLNIYQHFELSSKLVLPFEKFELQFYWDKDRDVEQKFLFGLEKNRYKGLYNVDIEYPNQKISAAFVLLPTQVTMNVTWGIKVSQRIYLKVGNKIYDVGGIWFGELETPFKYLEKQQFQLKYYILSKTFEVQSDISWRRHSMHLLLSGSKSSDHLAGVIQLNTTLPEISKIGAAMTHRLQVDNNYKTDATLVYNEHQITAQSNWKVDGLQVTSNFRVESSPDSILPIYGDLLVNSNDTKSLFFELHWQSKLIRLVSLFRADASMISIFTPFEGFENTILEYSVKADSGSVLLGVTINLLKQYNNLHLRWTNTEKAMEFCIDVESPVTGYYSLHFTHSTVLGILKESFTIKGHEYKDIVHVKLEGYIISLLEMNLTTFLKLLEHKASLTIENSREPISSSIRASWDDFKIDSTSTLIYDTRQVVFFNWLVETNALPKNEKIHVNYENINEQYVVIVQLPKAYLLNNTLFVAQNYELVENHFNLVNGRDSISLQYKHENSVANFDQKLRIDCLGEVLDYSVSTHHVDKTPTLKVHLDVPYSFWSSGRKRLAINGEGKFDTPKSSVHFKVERTDEAPITFNSNYKCTDEFKTFNLEMIAASTSIRLGSVAVLNGDDGHVSITSEATGESLKWANAQLKATYNLGGKRKNANVELTLEDKKYLFDVALQVYQTFSVDLSLKRDVEKLFGLELAINKSMGIAVFTYSAKKIRMDYVLNRSGDPEIFISLFSNVDFVPNFKVNATYVFGEEQYKSLLDFQVSKYVFLGNTTFTVKSDLREDYLYYLVNAKVNAEFQYKDDPSSHRRFAMATDASLDLTPSAGEAFLHLASNIPKVQLVELDYKYSTGNKGYDATAMCNYNSDVYKVEFSNVLLQNIFAVTTIITAPSSTEVTFNITLLQENSSYTTKAALNVNGEKYSVDVLTRYGSPYDVSSTFKVRAPKVYLGSFALQLRENVRLFDASVTCPESLNNRATLSWQESSLEALIQADSIQLAPHTLKAEYTLTEQLGHVVVNAVADEAKYKLSGNITKTKLNLRLDKGDKVDYIVVGGTHKLNSLHDFSISYGIFKEGKRIKVDLLNFFGETYQTKIDVSTHINGWNRLTLESKLDQDKIRISVNARNHYMSLIAKKFNPKGDEILSVKVQGETLLEVWSGTGQTTLRTSGRFGKYRAFIQCSQNPGIYAFSILRGAENLISLMLQNLTTDSHIDFKGRLIAPELIPNFSNISLQFTANRDLTKSTQFHIYNRQVQLFEISWYTKVEIPGKHVGFIRFQSQLHALESFEILSSINVVEDTTFDTNVKLLSRGKEVQYAMKLLIPHRGKHLEINVQYPCHLYPQCEFYFSLKPKYLDSRWTTPFEAWKNVSLRANVHLEGGEFAMINSNHYFDLSWSAQYKDDVLLVNFGSHNNIDLLRRYLLDVDVKAMYKFYRSLLVYYTIEESDGRLRLEVYKDAFETSAVLETEGMGVDGEIFGSLKDNEDGLLYLIFNDRELFRASKGKIAGKDHSHFFKARCDILLKSTLEASYDLHDFDRNAVNLEFKNNATYFLGQTYFGASATFTGNFSSGSGNILRNADAYALKWSSDFSGPGMSGFAKYKHNKHETYIVAQHHLRTNSVNSSLVISCGQRKMEATLLGVIVNSEELQGSFELTTPLLSLAHVRAQTILRNSDNNYYAFNRIQWPDKQHITLTGDVSFDPNDKSLAATFNSSFTEPINSSVQFKHDDEYFEFAFDSAAAGEFVKLKAELLLGVTLSGNLSTSFEGYKTCNVTCQIDRKEGTIQAEMSKENLTLSVAGRFTNLDDAYEINMNVVYPDGSADEGRASVKVNENEFNATMHFYNDAMKVDLGLDNNMYQIYLRSPYEYAKEVNLKGVYTNDVNIFSLETDGNWNEFLIEFNGVLQVVPAGIQVTLVGKAGDDYKGEANLAYTKEWGQRKLEFKAYFPRPDNSVQLQFNSSHNNGTVLMETPFPLFSSLQLQSTFKKFEQVQMALTGNIMGKKFVSHTSGRMNSTNLHANISVEIPEIHNTWNIEVAADRNKGVIAINKRSLGNYDFITMNYTTSLGKFTGDFNMVSSRYNSSNSMTLLYNDGPNLEYGIIFDDFVAVERINVEDLKMEFLLKAPRFRIRQLGLQMDKGLTAKLPYTCQVFYNDFNVRVILSPTLTSGQVSYDVLLLPKGEIDFALVPITHGYQLKTNLALDSYPINVTLNYTNSPTELTLNYDVLLLGTTDTGNLYLRKNLEKFVCYISDNLDVQFEYDIRSRLFVNLMYVNQANHTLEMDLSQNAFFFEITSSLIPQENLQIILNTFTESHEKLIKLYLKEQGLLTYTSTFALTSSPSNSYELKWDLVDSTNQLMEVDIAFVLHRFLDAGINVKIFDDTHAGNITVNINGPYIIQLNLESPYLKNGKIEFHVQATNLQTATLYVSSGDKALENYVHFQSASSGKTININLEIPQLHYFKLFKVAITWDFEANSTSKNYLQIDSDYLGDILIVADFVLLPDLLDIETHLRLPFLEDFESLDGKVYIPKEFRPKIKIILPKNHTYALYFNHSLTSDVIFINAGYQCSESKLDLLLNLLLEEAELHTELTLPNEYLRFLSVDIQKRNYLLDVNQRQYSLSWDYHNDEKSKMFNVALITPYQSYKEYSLDFEYRMGVPKMFKFLVLYPGFDRKIGTTFSFNYKNLRSIQLFYNIYSPYKINDFDFIELKLISDLETRNIYVVECTASTNKYNTTINAGAMYTGAFKEFLLDAFVNEQQLHTHFQLVGESLRSLDVLVDVKTPFDYLESFHLGFNTSTSVSELRHSDRIVLTHNSNPILTGDLVMKQYSVHFLTQNMWRSFSVDYRYMLNNVIDLYAKLCWDLEQPHQSQVGGHLYLGENLSTGLYLPNNTLAFDVASKSDDINETYMWKASWNEVDVEMLSSIVNYTTKDFIHLYSSSYLQLPFRKYSLVQRIQVSTEKVQHMNSSFELAWGDTPSAKLTLETEILPGKFASKLTTAALEHDVALKFDMSKFNCIPSQITAEFQYSNDPDRLLQFEIYYNKVSTNFFKSERNFILKHPASKIDYELYFNSMRKKDYSNGSVVLKYRNFDTNNSESIKALVKVDHDKFGILGEIVTHRNSFHFEAASKSEDDNIGLLLKAKVNEKDPLHLEYTYNFKQVSPSINFMALYGENRKYIFYAGLPNDREITAKLGHDYYGKYFLDSLLTMKLNTSQLLWVKILWKKEVYPQFYKAIFEEYNDLRFVIEATGKELIDVISDDIGKEFVKDITAIKNNITSYTKAQKALILSDFRNSKTTCSDSNYICGVLMHPKFVEIRNVVFGPVQDFLSFCYEGIEKANVFESLQYTFDVINEQIDQTLRDIKNIKNIKIDAKDILKRGISDARKSLKEMETIAIKLLDDFDKYIGSLKVEVEEFLEPFLNLLDDLVAYIEQRLVLLQLAVLDILDTIQYYIYNLRETKEMFRVYSSYLNWLEEFHVTDILQPIGDVVEAILDTIITDVKRVTEHYKPYLDALSEAIFGKYDGISQLPPVIEFKELVNRFYQKTIWIWNYQNMTESLKSLIHKLSHDIDDLLLFIEMDESHADFENHFGQADYIFRPEVGLIEISQPLSFEWEAFNKPPTFEQHPLYQKIHRKCEQFVKVYKSRYDLIDDFGNLLDELSEPTLAPTTHNFAIIVGKSHFATFNNRYYNFASNCSYVLASDFKTNSFSLVINYKEQGGVTTKSLEVISGDSSIEILPDFTVAFNQEKVELPLIYHHITVVREYSNLVVKSTKGFKLECNVHYDFCTVQLSGWLFGKTAGLLGTLDNEKVTDTDTSNGTRTASIAEFIDSWKLQEECKVSNKNSNKVQVLPLVDHVMGNFCNLFFANKNSPLYDCFDRVSPKPFLEICMEDMRDMTKTGICSSIAAYRVKCRKANVNIEMPDLCVNCDDDIGMREKIFDGHNPQSLDVVFITQLDCFNGTRTPLPVKLDESLNRLGYKNNRFASVGFGGHTLTKPHIYTSSNQIWSESPPSIKYKYNYKNWNMQQYKAVDAIKFASTLSFRPGVPKLFVLSYCDGTSDMENAPHIYNMLGEKDVTLHVLTQQPFGNYSGEVLGLRTTDVYTLAKRVPTPDQVLDQIEDVYCGLALSTNGTVYDFNAALRDSSIWAEFIVATVKRSPCQKCKCVPDQNGVGKVECSRCLAPAVKQFLTEYENNNKMKFGQGSN